MRQGRRHRGRIVTAAIVSVLLVGAAACSDDASDAADDATDAAGDAIDEVEERVGEAGARAGAEAFRVSLREQDVDGAAGGLRSIEVLQTAADDLPGDPEITGIEDGNGDGIDDDGFVQFVVSDEQACVEVPESGDDIEVTGGACPSG
jgi:hypothetical protein